MSRGELLSKLVDVYMDNLLDNPEVVREALTYYLDGFNNEVLEKTLAGFGETS